MNDADKKLTKIFIAQKELHHKYLKTIFANFTVQYSSGSY